MDKAVDTPDLAAEQSCRELEFRKDINGLRALAVLGVVAFHADRALVPGGFAGVDVFFVISGFLISRIILSECAAGHFSLSRFYAKRAKRILPALLIVVSAVSIVGWFRSDPAQYQEIGAHLMGNSYFTVNFWIMRIAGTAGYFAPDASGKPLLHLWSLSIEEQFYLVWSVLLLAVFRLNHRLLPYVILSIFVASFAYCVGLTPINPIGAFYLPWTRAWELALGALLAYREVFLLRRWPYPSGGLADIGAALGVALIVAGYFFLSEAEPFPGWRAALPTAGCALIIAHPRSFAGEVGLGNPVAAFFGLISYPLYLWHWPLFAFARTWPGFTPLTAAMFALAVAAVGLAALTHRLIEVPIAVTFRRRPAAVALMSVAALALTGVVGRRIVQAHGYVDRFPPVVQRIFDYQSDFRGRGEANSPLARCTYERTETRYPLAEERERARRFFNPCASIADPLKPTIMVVGDSHAAHLFAGLSREFGDRANLIALTAQFCVPLIENVAMNAGWGGTPRCHAINQIVFEKIRAIRPDILLVGAYFAQYVYDPNWRYPDYLERFEESARRLRADGVGAVVIAGQIPTWGPPLPILVGRDILGSGKTSEFARLGLNLESLSTDKALAAKDWGNGVIYVSQAAKLCGPDGCRRLVGPNLPEDMLAVDYGHYSVTGSIFAVKTILGPAIETALATARKPR